MISLENREVSTWDIGDRLSFALAGLNRTSADALKEGLGPIRGFTTDYPTRLLDQIDFWVDQIREIEQEALRFNEPGDTSQKPYK